VNIKGYWGDPASFEGVTYCDLEYKKGWNTISYLTLSTTWHSANYQYTSHEPEGAKWIYLKGYYNP